MRMLARMAAIGSAFGSSVLGPSVLGSSAFGSSVFGSSVFGSLALLLFGSSSVFSDTLAVPQTYPTIQAAIDAAVAGDVVLVAPDEVNGGPYLETLDFRGKAIVVRSSDGPEVTTIDANHTGVVVTFKSGEGPDSVIEGFTITHGSGGGIQAHAGTAPIIRGNIVTANMNSGLFNGAGIQCDGATVVDNVISHNREAGISCRGSSWIANNTIHDNTTSFAGGGIVCVGSCTIRDNLIRDNRSEYDAGGIYLLSGTVLLTGNVIARNVAASKGGGIKGLGSRATISNCLFLENRARSLGGGLWNELGGLEIANCVFFRNEVAATGRGGGLAFSDDSHPLITNTILWANGASALQGPELYVGNWEVVATISYSAVEGGLASVQVDSESTLLWGDGMIESDPLFLAPERQDFHLRTDSPCVDAGDANAPGIPLTDDEGDERSIDGNRDGQSEPDIGMDEMRLAFSSRYGRVDLANGTSSDVLFVNGSAGDSMREVRLPTLTPFEITMTPAPAGPDPAPFVLYAWLGEPSESSASMQPYALGPMCFPTFLAPGLPKPRVTWNNIGLFQQLGETDRASEPAPSVVLAKPAGWPAPLTVTFQGFVLDDGSLSEPPGTKPSTSITNAVVLRIE